MKNKQLSTCLLSNNFFIPMVQLTMLIKTAISPLQHTANPASAHRFPSPAHHFPSTTHQVPTTAHPQRGSSQLYQGIARSGIC